jgi:hypothetical protein
MLQGLWQLLECTGFITQHCLIHEWLAIHIQVSPDDFVVRACSLAHRQQGTFSSFEFMGSPYVVRLAGQPLCICCRVSGTLGLSFFHSLDK